MKKLLIIFMSVLFFGCGKEEIKKPVNLDPYAMISIKPAVQTRGLSGLSIVENASIITFTGHYWNNVYDEYEKVMDRAFNEDQKDFDTPSLKMYGTDIIALDGTYWREFIYSRDVFIVDYNGDSIAHIPNEVLYLARLEIEKAYLEEDFEKIYELFDTAFTFIPIE